MQTSDTTDLGLAATIQFGFNAKAQRHSAAEPQPTKMEDGRWKMDVCGGKRRATPLFDHHQPGQSGVALRFPPQSMTPSRRPGRALPSRCHLSEPSSSETILPSAHEPSIFHLPSSILVGCGSLKLTALAALAAVALCAGCSEQPGHTADDGHGHAAAAHGEAPAHVVTKDGVAMCTEHGVPEAECAVCKPDLAATLKPGESMKLRLPFTNSATIVGVQTATPEVGAMADGVECVGEVSFNQNKLAQISAPVSGIVQTVDVDLGAQVEERQTVAKIWSAAIAEAVAKAVLSHQTLSREQRLRADRVTSEKDFQEAEAAHRSACQQLRTLGFTEEQIEELSQKPQEQVLMEVRAPFAGEIVERTAVRGALVDAGKPLFTLVDHSTVWAMLQVPEAALARVKTGQAVELRVDSLPGRVFTGKLTWIGPAVDERTRMARARAEFANPERLLKDKMFATARILTRRTEGALLVPPAAIQHIGGKALVFVKLGEDLFDARAVTLGARFDGRQEVLAGLKPDEQIAVSHAFAIKSAMLMSRLGAGCADD